MSPPRRAEWDPARGRQGSAWRRITRSILVPGCICAWCGQEIDTTLHHLNPWAGTVDHMTALADGGHPTDTRNLTAMHRGCNSRKEMARRRIATAARAIEETRPSRNW